MRILLFFILGLVLAFYGAAFLAWVTKRLRIKSKFGAHSSFIGLIILFFGIINLFLGKPWFGDPLSSLLSTFLIGAGIGTMVHHLLAESFLFSEKAESQFVREHEGLIERILEIIPGALTWLALSSPIWLSFTLPFAVAYIILIADIYWLFSAGRIAVLVIVGYKKMEAAKKINWLNKLKENFPGEWENYYQLLVLPTYKEGLEVLEPAFEAIINSKYHPQKIFLAIGLEARDTPEKMAAVRKYARENRSRIGGIFVTVHPFGLPGEIAGPGTNRRWAINEAVKEFAKRGIPLDKVITTTLDADFVIHPQFLAGMLHKYLSTPADVRNKRSFTGSFLYNNNYWDCPAFTRLIASGTAYWQLSEMVGSDKYINFSSMSMNLRSLMDVGLWMPDKVNDDSGFYWKAYYHYKGDYKVIPHYLPISADTVLDVNLVKTVQNQYLQLKRWAYGVEHMPFIIKQYFTSKNLDFWDKTDKLIFVTWSYMKWGTLALFITFAGLLVPMINSNYSQSVVAYNMPLISSWILTGAFVGLFSTIYVHEKTVPPRPKNWSVFKKFWSYIQWALIPIILVTIASLPALDAQTRLMLGKYISYRVTNKVRLSHG